MRVVGLVVAVLLADSPKRILWACENLAVDPAKEARFTAGPSPWLRVGNSTAMNAPSVVRPWQAEHGLGSRLSLHCRGSQDAKMTSRPPAQITFVCLKCGRGYRATQEQFPYERPGRFDCKDCNAEVHSWTGVYDFIGWKAIETKPITFGAKH